MKTQLNRLNDLIPDYYDDITEPHDLAAGEQPLLDDLEAAIFDGQNSQSVITADSAALSVYESMLGIIPQAGDTLETRRYNVLMEVLPPQPLTEPYLRQLLQVLNINATVSVYGRQFEVNIIASPTDKGSTQRLTSLLDRYLPANLTFTHQLQLPNRIYIGAAANLNRTLTSRSSLLDDREFSATAGQLSGTAIARVEHTLVTVSDVFTDRVSTSTLTSYAGAAAQMSVALVTDATK